MMFLQFLVAVSITLQCYADLDDRVRQESLWTGFSPTRGRVCMDTSCSNDERHLSTSRMDADRRYGAERSSRHSDVLHHNRAVESLHRFANMERREETVGRIRFSSEPDRVPSDRSVAFRTDRRVNLENELNSLLADRRQRDSTFGSITRDSSEGRTNVRRERQNRAREARDRDWIQDIDVREHEPSTRVNERIRSDRVVSETRRVFGQPTFEASRREQRSKNIDSEQRDSFGRIALNRIDTERSSDRLKRSDNNERREAHDLERRVTRRLTEQDRFDNRDRSDVRNNREDRERLEQRDRIDNRINLQDRREFQRNRFEEREREGTELNRERFESRQEKRDQLDRTVRSENDRQRRLVDREDQRRENSEHSLNTRIEGGELERKVNRQGDRERNANNDRRSTSVQTDRLDNTERRETRRVINERLSEEQRREVTRSRLDERERRVDSRNEREQDRVDLRTREAEDTSRRASLRTRDEDRERRVEERSRAIENQRETRSDERRERSDTRDRVDRERLESDKTDRTIRERREVSERDNHRQVENIERFPGVSLKDHHYTVDGLIRAFREKQQAKTTGIDDLALLNQKQGTSEWLQTVFALGLAAWTTYHTIMPTGHKIACD